MDILEHIKEKEFQCKEQGWDYHPHSILCK